MKATDIIYTNSASIGNKVARFSNLTVLNSDIFSVQKKWHELLKKPVYCIYLTYYL